MLYRLTLILALLFAWTHISAQIENTGMTDRSDSVELGKLKITGCVDVYYGHDLGQTASTDRPYASSSARLHEITINLAYISFKYENENVRFLFAPAFGTYINTNNVQEPGSLKNILEANGGIRLSKKRDIWLDAGIFGAPYTNETALSKDQIMYTRSLAAENSPYYLSGVRLTYPLSKKVNGYLYLINGWQQMADKNKPLSIGTQIEYRPTNKVLVNWSTYMGSEQTTATPCYRKRFFNDLYIICKPTKKITLTSCVSFGWQEVKDSITKDLSYHKWWQINVMGKYQFTPKISLAGRLEYFEDMDEVVILPANSTPFFSTYGSSLCFDYKIGRNALLRLEGRNYFAAEKVFPEQNVGSNNTYQFFIGNITVWF